jgi:hypothetical protein
MKLTETMKMLQSDEMVMSAKRDDERLVVMSVLGSAVSVEQHGDWLYVIAGAKTLEATMLPARAAAVVSAHFQR